MDPSALAKEIWVLVGIAAAAAFINQMYSLVERFYKLVTKKNSDDSSNVQAIAETISALREIIVAKESRIANLENEVRTIKDGERTCQIDISSRLAVLSTDMDWMKKQLNFIASELRNGVRFTGNLSNNAND